MIYVDPKLVRSHVVSMRVQETSTEAANRRTAEVKAAEAAIIQTQVSQIVTRALTPDQPTTAPTTNKSS